MASPSAVVASGLDAARLASRLAAQASLEIGVHEAREFLDARPCLVAGQRIYVSHLPGQGWESTFRLCAQLSAAGFDPVPHLPVRLIEHARQLDRVLAAACGAGVHEALLISGDYACARGEFESVLAVLRTGALQAHGLRRVSLAGHPEGHPRVPWDVICEAQIDKWREATAAGLEVTFVTQFFFAAEPFVQWARMLRAGGVQARLVAGVAGPTGIGRLVKLAARCGVGASVRTLTARPSSMLRLLGDHRPDDLILELAAEKRRQDALFDGLHVFSLGGFLRTCSWLRQFQAGRAD